MVESFAARFTGLLSVGPPLTAGAPADNPYAKKSGRKVDRAILEGLVKAETNGKALYDLWADNTANGEAAALFRQNGLEEAKHGARALEAIGLLEA